MGVLTQETHANRHSPEPHSGWFSPQPIILIILVVIITIQAKEGTLPTIHPKPASHNRTSQLCKRFHNRSRDFCNFFLSPFPFPRLGKMQINPEIGTTPGARLTRPQNDSCGVGWEPSSRTDGGARWSIRGTPSHPHCYAVLHQVCSDSEAHPPPTPWHPAHVPPLEKGVRGREPPQAGPSLPGRALCDSGGQPVMSRVGRQFLEGRGRE